LLVATSAAATAAADDDIVTVPVEYGGDDLHATARLLGVSPEVLVAHHVNAVWRVAFIGFAPGFGYLVSDDWPFQVPRLEAPRTRVPAGSVALAGAFAGAYPRESPGGWRLVGHTDVVLWDAASDDPALFAPARRVRFRAVRP
jgi:KipI family sensor histidine kinase inhibitor